MLNIIEALYHIDPETDYETWYKIGMSLEYAGRTDSSITWQVWDEWSKQDTRPKQYKPGQCALKWSSFQGEGITEGTVYGLGLKNGYKPSYDGGRFLDWDSTIYYTPEPTHSETVNYLKLLYKDDDVINYVVKSFEEDDKYKPTGYGVNIRVGDLIEKLERYDEIEYAIGDYNHDAGAWIRINPLDGEGVKNENVTDYRYCLVESDELEVDEQLKKIMELKLPCAAIVYSGGKSLHAIMHVDAESEEEYKKRTKWIFEVLEEQGFKIDQNNKNAARLTRLPGVERGKTYQTLVRGRTGLKDFYEWEDYIQHGLGEELLPDILSYSEVVDNPPPLKPELIEGVLRQSHKMIIAGASKSGKSYSLIDLAVCVAQGEPWLGFNCREGKVLYINMEIDPASFWKRLEKVYGAKAWENPRYENIDVWNLRGHAMPMERMADYILRKTRGKDYSLIILDPIYKVLVGDENSSGDVKTFTNNVDRVVTETGASFVYCHHHSKGAQNGKRSMDRSSGSGVFARDADAVLDVIELSNETYRNFEFYKDFRAFRIEADLREFGDFKPVNVFFDFPCYRLDVQDILRDAKTLDEYMANKPKQREKKQTKKKFQSPPDVRFYDKFEELSNGSGTVSETDLMEKLKVGDRQLEKMYGAYNKKVGYKMFSKSNGQINKKVIKDNERTK